MNRLTATAALLLSTSGMAFAAGPEPLPPQPMVAAPAPAAVSWDGLYAGGQVGYAFSDFDLDPGNFDDEGVVGGFHVGYRFGLGNGWYLGPEFQYDWADLTVEPLGGPRVHFDEMARLKLVAGREVGPRSLAYGSIGYAYGDYGDPGDLLDASNDSWVAGIGYDYSLGNNWTLGGEYQYHDFNGVELQTIHVKVGFQF